jgi:hypothetical protein
MILDFLLFPVYVSLIILLGLGFARFLFFIARFEAPQYDLWLLLLFGQFGIGIISLAVNFASGVFTPATYILIFLFAGLGLANVGRIRKAEYLILLLFALAIVPLVVVMEVGYDGGLYHLPHQLWLRTEKVVFGLANFHGRFGFSSIQEYIAAPQWVNNHFKLLSYSSAIYFLAFLLFLCNWLSGRDISKIILALLLIISLIFFNSFILWRFTNTDDASGFIFAITFLYGLEIISDRRAGERNILYESYVLIFLTLFSFYYKLSGVFITLWAFYILWILYRRNLISPKMILKISIGQVIIFIAWISKGIITTGCLAYPVSATCLSCKWSALYWSIKDTNWITSWARHPKSGLYSLDSIAWFNNWWIGQYSGFLLNLGIVSISLILITVSISMLLKSRMHISSHKLVGISILMISLGFWFLNAPTPRFGVGTFLLFPSILAFLFIDNDRISALKFRIPKYIQLGLFIGLIISVTNFNKISRLKDKLLLFNSIEVVTPEVVNKDVFGVSPMSGDQCWLIPYCTPYKGFSTDIINGHIFFMCNIKN